MNNHKYTAGLNRHFGVYAVVISANAEQILVVVKSRGPYKGCYDLPGGALQAGETEEEGLDREIAEETGGVICASLTDWNNFDLEVRNDSAGNPINFRHSGQWKQVSLENVDLNKKSEEDVAALKWIPIAELQHSSLLSAPLKHILQQLN